VVVRTTNNVAILVAALAFASCRPADPLPSPAATDAAEPVASAETRPAPPEDARRIEVSVSYDDGDPVVGLVVEAELVYGAEGPDEGVGARWFEGDVRHHCAQLDAHGRATLFVPPVGRFVVRNATYGAEPYEAPIPPEDADYVEFRSDVVDEGRSSVRVVVRAAVLNLEARDERGRPVAGRPFYLQMDDPLGGGQRRTTDRHGRARWHFVQPGQVRILDHGRLLPQNTKMWRAHRPAMKRVDSHVRHGEFGPQVVREFVDPLPSFAVVAAYVDGQLTELDDVNVISARLPGEVRVEMRPLPLACLRVVDAAGRGVPQASVRVDVGFAGRMHRETLDVGHTDLDGRAFVEVPSDGDAIAFDAPLTTLRWRVSDPLGLDERVVEVPISARDSFVDCGVATLPRHRTWKIRLGEGADWWDFDSTAGSVPDVRATDENRGGSSRLFNGAPDFVFFYPRPDDRFLRIRRRDDLRSVYEVVIDDRAAAIDGPGQLVVVDAWRTLEAAKEEAPPPTTSRRTQPVPPRLPLIVRVESVDGAPLEGVSVSERGAGSLGRTDAQGVAETEIRAGPVLLCVENNDPAAERIPWSIEFVAAPPEARVTLRARPVREVTVRVKAERPGEPWSPDDVSLTARVEGSPALTLEHVASDASQDATAEGAADVVERRYRAPADAEVVVACDYFGEIQTIRVPPGETHASFAVGPAYPVRWVAPHYPYLIWAALSITPQYGQDTVYADEIRVPPRTADRANGELRLPPGRYRAALRARAYRNDDEDVETTDEYVRIVEVVPGVGARIEFAH
jgi:hypothetical protein